MIVLFKIRNFYVFIQNPILKRNIKVIGIIPIRDIKNHENIKIMKHLITNIINKFTVFYIHNK